jgi:CheY-like chemotaxis protein
MGEKQIGQVIMNLVQNARDAMPMGGRLAVGTANVTLDEEIALRYYLPAAGRYVCLSISDTGVGMSEETLSHIFEPFFTTKEPGKGPGLGLAIVYGIVKQCQGSIIIESQVGVGTTCRVFLPRADDEQAGVRPESTARDDQSRGTVLIVEDEEMVRELTRRILEQEGYNVIEARDAKQALEWHGSHEGPIQLMITDIVMPQMSGYDLAEKVAAERPETRIIFMSGFINEAIERPGLPPSRAGFLKKPFTPDELTYMVRTLVEAGN